MSKTRKALSIVGIVLLAALPGGLPIIAGLYVLNKYKLRKGEGESEHEAT